MVVEEEEEMVVVVVEKAVEWKEATEPTAKILRATLTACKRRYAMRHGR